MAVTNATQDGRVRARQEEISQQVEARFVGDFLAAERILGIVNLSRNASEIEIEKLGDDDFLKYIDTRRSPLDDYKEVDLTRSTRKHDFGHYGLQATKSFEAMIFESMRPVNKFTSVTYQTLVAVLMRQSQEVLRTAMLIDPTNYPVSGHAVNLSGVEWDVGGGDLKGDIQAGVNLIRVAKNISRDKTTLWLPFHSFEAALADTGFNAALAATASLLALTNQAADGQLTALKQYLGVDIETDFFSSHEIVGGDGVRQNSWGDTAILYVDPVKMNTIVHPLPGLTAERFGAVYRQGAFARTQTFQDLRNNSWKWRRDDAQRSWITQDTMAVLFYNTATTI